MTVPGGSQPQQPDQFPQQPTPPYSGGQYGSDQYGGQQYPHPAYPPPYASGPPRRSGVRRAGAWLFFIGLPLLVIGIVVMVLGFGRAAGSFDPADFDAPSTEIVGVMTVDLAAGDTRSLAARNSTTDVAQTCTVAGPGGPVAVVPAEVLGEPIPNLANFTASDTGEHTVECSSADVVLGPHIDPGSLAGAGLALVGGFLLAGLGALLALVGAIMWLVGRSRDNAAVR